MEIKKSHNADIERLRPAIFAGALAGTTLLFVAILFIPFKSLGQMAEDFFDDYEMDLDIKPQEQDDMIAAALPQEAPPQKEEAAKLNKVENVADLPPEQLEQATDQEEAEEEKIEDPNEEVPPINPNEDDPEALKIIEQLPQYPGGMVEFMKWLTATLKYPDAALKQKIQGKVMISFIVNADGSLSDIKVTKPAHALLNKEALRVARMMPKWEPGIDKGKPCKSMVAIPIVFEI